MPNSTSTTYLQETYKILAKIPDISAMEDKYKDGNNIKISDVFKDINNKVETANRQINENKFFAFKTAWDSFKKSPENTEICKKLNPTPSINTLIVNPEHKNIVAGLIELINLESVFDETVALSLIKQQLQEFFELSRLADYASYDTWRVMYNKDSLLTLGTITQLELCFVIDNLKKFFSHEKDNQEIKTIAATIISYLGQSAIAKGYPSTNKILSFFATNLEAVKTSFVEDEQSLRNAFGVYLKNVKINQNKEINGADEIYYDALDEQDGKKLLATFDEDEEFFDAFETLPKKEVKAGLSASAETPNESNPTKNSSKEDNIPSDFEKIIRFLKKIILLLSIVSSIERTNLLINFLIVNIAKDRKEPRTQTNYKFNPENSYNPNLNPPTDFSRASNEQGEDSEDYLSCCSYKL